MSTTDSHKGTTLNSDSLSLLIAMHAPIEDQDERVRRLHFTVIPRPPCFCISVGSRVLRVFWNDPPHFGALTLAMQHYLSRAQLRYQGDEGNPESGEAINSDS